MLWSILITVIVLLGVAIYIFPIVEVCGCSMCPTFHSGDIILCCRFCSIDEKSIYVFNPPLGEKYVIKRLTQINPTTDKLFFEGDNPKESYDSRMYGYVSQDKIVAKYIFTIHKRKECNYNGCK